MILVVGQRSPETNTQMKRWRLVILALATIGIISTFWLQSAYKNAADAVRIQFVGMTNDPALGPSALLCVTNQAVSVVVCAKLTPQVYSWRGWVDVDNKSSSGLAYLQRGESCTFSVPIPSGTRPWRVPVLWQRQELTRFEGFLNLQHRRLLVLCGEPNVHRDAWVPFGHIVYSPRIDR